MCCLLATEISTLCLKLKLIYANWQVISVHKTSVAAVEIAYRRVSLIINWLVLNQNINIDFMMDRRYLMATQSKWQHKAHKQIARCVANSFSLNKHRSLLLPIIRFIYICFLSASFSLLIANVQFN